MNEKRKFIYHIEHIYLDSQDLNKLTFSIC